MLVFNKHKQQAETIVTAIRITRVISGCKSTKHALCILFKKEDLKYTKIAFGDSLDIAEKNMKQKMSPDEFSSWFSYLFRKNKLISKVGKKSPWLK